MNINMQNAFIAGLASGGVVVGDGTKSHAVIGNLEIASVPSGYSEYTVQIGEEITTEYVVSLGLVGGPYSSTNILSMWYYISQKTSTSFKIGVYVTSSMTNVTFEWAVVTNKTFSTCDYGVNNGMIDNYNISSGTTSINIVFDTPKASTDYFVIANCGRGATYFALARFWITNKSTTGFTINVYSYTAISNTAIRWFCVDKSGTDPEPDNVIFSTAELQQLSTNTGYSLAKVTNTEIGATSNEDVCIFYSFRNRIGNTNTTSPFGVSTALGTDQTEGEYSELTFWSGDYYGKGQVTDFAFVACQHTT